jgi:hypothetical protein
MEEVRKEFRAKERRVKLQIKNKEEKAMAEVKMPDLKIADITDVIKETNGLVKENYLAGFELTISLWEENLKVLSSQFDKWVASQKDCMNLMKDFQGKSSTEATNGWGIGLKPLVAQTEWFVSLQKDYLESVRVMSDKFAKDVINLNQKNVEKAFSVFSGYLGLFGFGR